MPEPRRGERNNNPLNLESNNIQWDGLVGHDGPYCVFDTAQSGLNAGARDLYVKWSKDNLRTVAQIVRKFAPPEDNDTNAYIYSVCKRLGVSGGDKLNLDDDAVFHNLLDAMVNQEEGRDIYSLTQVAAAILHARRSRPMPEPSPDPPPQPIAYIPPQHTSIKAAGGTAILTAVFMFWYTALQHWSLPPMDAVTGTAHAALMIWGANALALRRGVKLPSLNGNGDQ